MARCPQVMPLTRFISDYHLIHISFLSSFPFVDTDGTQLLGVDADGNRLAIQALPNDPDLLTQLTKHKVSASSLADQCPVCMNIAYSNFFVVV